MLCQNKVIFLFMVNKHHFSVTIGESVGFSYLYPGMTFKERQ